jgi:hypothetical protein
VRRLAISEEIAHCTHMHPMGAAHMCGRGGPSMKARAVGLLMVPTTVRWSNNTHSLTRAYCVKFTDV